MLQQLRTRMQNFQLTRKHLALAALAVFSIALFKAVYSPIAKKHTQIAALNRQLAAQTREQALAKRCESQLVTARTQCVSGDPTVALHQYQQWLLRRAESQKDVTVSPGTIVPEEPLGWRVKMELEGKADLGWIVRLVEDLESLPLLHRISFLRVNGNERRSRDAMDFAVTIDLLVCKGAETLAQWPDPIEQAEPYQLARHLSEHQPFTRGYKGDTTAPILTAQKTETSKPEPAPKIDPLATLGFVGTVTVSGVPMACVVDSRTQQELYVGPNSSFDFASYHGTVIEVTADRVELSQNNVTLDWQLGESLRDALKRASVQ